MPLNLIPPEALTGCECLVWLNDREEPTFGACIDGEWAIDGGYPYVRVPVTRAIPISWCLAAPGMREALKMEDELRDLEMRCPGLPSWGRFKKDWGLEMDVAARDSVANKTRAALAACDGKGE